MTALAYNVLYNATDTDASLAAIDAAQADIVCLRELTPAFARAFETRFASRFPYRRLVPVAGTWGVGIASRFPMSGAEVFPEKPHRIPAMEARIDTPAGSLSVACLHLFPPVGKHRKDDGFFETMDKNATLRHDQAAYLVERYKARGGPMILFGDMNESRDDAAVQTFVGAGFKHSCDAPESDCGATFPGPALIWPAVFQIDHILGRGVTFLAAAVIRAGGSDHYPVVAELTLP